MSAPGPSSNAINHSDGVMVSNARIRVIDITDQVAHRIADADRPPTFADALGDAPPTNSIIGKGDLLAVNIWEAPPAVLFGSSSSFGTGGSSSPLSQGPIGQSSAIPELMVDDAGRIRLPFAGSIVAAGRTPPQVEREIVSRLTGMAHEPQVSVRIASNTSSAVTVIGDVGKNGQIPLTPRGEKVLDAIEAAGGVNQPVGELTVQVSRHGRTSLMPLDAVISDPRQNIRLAPSDIVTVLFKPFSFTALGTTGTNTEVPFESTGLSLAEALARSGGLKDQRANPKGAYIFRFEDPSAVDPLMAANSPRTPNGKIPVIYRADLRNPATLFAAQHFPMRDKDILYIATAPISDLQNFVGILSSLAFTVIGLGNAVP
jgi:polysaccharide export outer membrane protein